MKPSEIFWTRFCNIVYAICVILSLQNVYTFCGDIKDIDVPVTITSKYATGYHNKNSVGEDFYLSCYNKTYGSMDIKVGHKLYSDTEVGGTTTFTLSKIKVDRYSTSNSDLTNDAMPIFLVFDLFVLCFLVFLICEFIFTKIIPKFNNYLDKSI